MIERFMFSLIAMAFLVKTYNIIGVFSPTHASLVIETDPAAE